MPSCPHLRLHLGDERTNTLGGRDEPGIAEHCVRLPDGIHGQAGEIH